MNIAELKHVHLIGIGGINLSAVAKLLRHAGIEVSGSDAVASEATAELQRQGVRVAIGETLSSITAGTDLVVYSSAVPETHVERADARRRSLRQLNGFEFLGEWTAEANVILVTGTHGKSTTTAALGLMLIQGQKDPTVIVGSRVPSFPEGNLHDGRKDLYVIEGDEYARHFLHFSPSAVIVNNLELDHCDIFPTLEAVSNAFRELLSRVRDKGLVVANADDRHVETLIGQERAHLEARQIRLITFGFGSHADVQIVKHQTAAGSQSFQLSSAQGASPMFTSRLPGKMNVMNMAAAATLASELGVPWASLAHTVANFQGIWRRFQKVAEANNVTVISDYAHHPTAVRATLEAARSFYPGRRFVVCFQPHQRHRTKRLFFDFVASLDQADAIVLAEIYDVIGRERREADDISSRDLRDALIHHDADRSHVRPIEYVANPQEALAALRQWRQPGDVIFVMGAGDIYQIADQVLATPV